MSVNAQVRDGSTMPKSVARNPKLAKRNARILRDANAVGKDGRRRYNQYDLAKKYNLTQGAISQILNNPNAIYFYA